MLHRVQAPGRILPAQFQRSMSGIFISYRREDSAAEAHRLYAALSARFGADGVFIDVEDIAPGDDFAASIEEKVGFCDALVAVIGPHWVRCTGADGRRRLDDPADWVRLEVGAALERELKVFPVLVGGAALPDARDLPPPLAGLTRYQALEVRAAAFERDAGRLAQAVESIRRGSGFAALWLSLVARGHTALDPLELHKPETLWRALRFLAVMVLVDAGLHLATAAIPGPAYRTLAYLAAYAAADFVQWLGIAFALHLAMRAVGGRGTLQKTVAAFCFLTAYLPLIAVAQIPVWGLNVEVTREAADVAWDPARAVEAMQAFVAGLGPFAVARIFASFAVATYVWWRLFSAAFRALRALHRLGALRTAAGMALGLAAIVAFVAFVVTPYFGSVYEKFTAREPALPVALAQLHLPELAGRGARDRVEELEAVRQLPLRKARGEVRA
jgi:hypothetical protein